MNAVAESRRGAVNSVPDILARAHEMTKRQLEEWFNWMDEILNIHRSNFVFREATPDELNQHRFALKEAIRTCNVILAVISDPDFAEPRLVSRLQVRIRQLRDAYDTFHDPTLTDQQADDLLREVFPT